MTKHEARHSGGKALERAVGGPILPRRIVVRVDDDAKL